MHCSVTANLALPVLHSSTHWSSANERIKSIWLEAKYEWCNKSAGEHLMIWRQEWTREGNCHILSDLPPSLASLPLFFFFALTKAGFSLWLWNIHRVEEQGRCQSVLLQLDLCLLPSQPCYTQCLCPCMQQVFSSCSWYKVSMFNVIKSDFRAVVPTAALILFTLHLACWLSVVIWGKLTFCSHLYWVRSLTLHGIDVRQWIRLFI